MKILIIEDEIFSAEKLQRIIPKVDADIVVLGVISSALNLEKWFNENEAPDLILADIQLSDSTSIDVFQRLNIKTPIIFTTAYDTYAIKAFKLNSIDYLLKPIDKEELSIAVQKFKSQKELFSINPDIVNNILGSSYKERFVLKKGITLVPVSTGEIAYFYSEEKTNYIKTNNGKKYIIDQSLDSLTKEVDPDKFYRINRYMVIHRRSLVKAQRSLSTRLKLTLEPLPEKNEIFVSRDKTADFKKWMNK